MHLHQHQRPATLAIDPSGDIEHGALDDVGGGALHRCIDSRAFGACPLAGILAVDFILNDIYPLIEKENPSIQITIAGKSMPNEAFEHMQDNLDIQGEVIDLYTFLSNQGTLLAPIFEIAICDRIFLAPISKIILSTSAIFISLFIFLAIFLTSF